MFFRIAVRTRSLTGLIVLVSFGMRGNTFARMARNKGCRFRMYSKWDFVIVLLRFCFATYSTLPECEISGKVTLHRDLWRLAAGAAKLHYHAPSLRCRSGMRARHQGPWVRVPTLDV